VTPERAREFSKMYVCPEAAAPLLLRWLHGADEEQRARAGLALAVLDSLVPLSAEAALWLHQRLHEESARELLRERTA
jgi:hypothetical protein